MTNNDELALKLKNQHIHAKYYLAECQECGELMPSNRLNVLTSPDGESECYCPHCQSVEINDLGIGDEPGALAWNFQQLRIEALLAERDADKKRIAEAYAGWGNCQLTMGVYCHAYEEAKAHITELIHNHRVHAARLIDERARLKERIAELEARTVSVKLPEGYKPHVQKYGTQSTSYRAVMSGKGPWIHRDILIEACAAAGIKLEVGE